MNLLAAQLPAALTFTDTVTTGSILIAAMVLVLGGLFTIRSNAAKTWRESYEAERTARELAEADANQQHKEKHELISDLAAARLATDLSGHQRFMAELMQKLSDNSTSQVVERLVVLERNVLDGFKQQNKVLERIADRLDYSADIVARDRQESDG